MQTVVITGASRGIGKFLAQELSTTYDIVGVARTAPTDFAGRFIEADVTDYNSLTAGVKKHELRRVYGLINCAGIASMNLFMTTPPETMRRIIEVNTLGTMNTCHAFLSSLVRNRTGRIINFSTIAVGLELEGESVYVASKAAVEAFTKVLAREVADHNITVNAVSPNPIETDLIRGVDPEKIRGIVEVRQTVHRLGEFKDVANVVQFLMNDESSLVSGQVVGLG